ncbi:MAG: 23S rRNA (guanosine(2251)-2'-O)-methyltransferase RlmB [Acidobacteria bacterium]|nr:23S rRNA (guanosine(2251)-2'-O)-methyltransferase RlmB [Acidobacteriota bacterium]
MRRVRPAMFLYGYHPIREALRHRPHQLARVLVSAARQGRRRQEIEELCRRHRVPVEAVAERALAAVAGRAHNGMAAELRPGAAGGAGAEPAAEPAADPAADPNVVVLLEDVQDPRNLGAVLRVCEGAGVGQILIRDRGSAPITPAVAKTAAGASEWLSIERITNSAATLEELKEAGFWVYGSDPGGEPPWRLDLTGKVVLCFGGEEKGLRARTRSLCDATVGLPMRGRLDSLNVATAAAGILYEALRQRLQAAAGGGE